ncbi:MAG: hypothetical protein QXU75_07060 [Candidatus Methanomethylicaceae archaeon]
MKFYNAFVGDLKWFSERKTAASYSSVGEALRRHLRYLTRKGRNAITLTFGCKNVKELVDNCLSELETRWDSVVAGKFFFTLPNDIADPEKFIENVLSQTLGPKCFVAVIHRDPGRESGKLNTHAHIVLYPRDNDGKKLRIDITKLRMLHNVYRTELARRGYVVVEQNKSSKLKQKEVVTVRETVIPRAKPAPTKKNKIPRAKPAPIEKNKISRAKPAPIEENRILQAEPAPIEENRITPAETAPIEENKIPQEEPAPINDIEFSGIELFFPRR